VKAKILGEDFISSFICAFLFLLLRAKEKETHPKKKKKRYFPTSSLRSAVQILAGKPALFSLANSVLRTSNSARQKIPTSIITN
jgi:hypothetical protein